MGGIDFPGLAQSLLGFGPAGLIIGYLLWERAGLMKENKGLWMAQIADVKTNSSAIASALATATQALQANNIIQEKAASSAALISHAVTTVSDRLERVEDAVEKVGEATDRLDRTVSGLASRGVH